jgi:CheY-like chemotaxis protein
MKKYVILIGDRNKNIRDFLKRELEAEGYEVMLAKDGREILSAACGHPGPDLVVMDLFLQADDGRRVLEEIQKANPKLPIIIYSSLVELKNDPFVKNAGAFIEKDEPLDSLKTAILKFLPSSLPSPGLTEASWKGAG